MRESFYYKGECGNEEIENDIKKRFIRGLARHILCFKNRANCTVANVKIYCGTTNVSIRRKRGVAEKEVDILGLT